MLRLRRITYLRNATEALSGSQYHDPIITHRPAASSDTSTSQMPLPFSPRSASNWAFWKNKTEGEKQWDQQSTSATSPSPSPDDPIADPSFFPLSESSSEAAVALFQAFDAVEKACIASAKLEVWLGSAWCMAGIQFVHSMGIPWWAAVAVMNISTRVVMSPLVVFSQRATAKMMIFNHSMLHAKKLQESMTQAKNPDEQQRLHHALKKEIDFQTQKHGSPVTTALVIPGVMLANTTVFISIFGATSKLMESKAPSLTEGGMLWFTDLTVPDPYYGLPIVCCLATLALVEYGISMTGEQAPIQGQMQKQAEAFKWLMRAMSFAFIPAGGYVSAGTAILWVSNSAFAVVQGICLRSDAFRKGVGLPTMAEMREMGAKIAEVAKPGVPLSPSLATLDIPVNPVTGKPVLLKTNPKLKKAPPPPGNPADYRKS